MFRRLTNKLAKKFMEMTKRSEHVTDMYIGGVATGFYISTYDYLQKNKYYHDMDYAVEFGLKPCVFCGVGSIIGMTYPVVVPSILLAYTVHCITHKNEPKRIPRANFHEYYNTRDDNESDDNKSDEK